MLPTKTLMKWPKSVVILRPEALRSMDRFTHQGSFFLHNGKALAVSPFQSVERTFYIGSMLGKL